MGYCADLERGTVRVCVAESVIDAPSKSICFPVNRRSRSPRRPTKAAGQRDSIDAHDRRGLRRRHSDPLHQVDQPRFVRTRGRTHQGLLGIGGTECPALALARETLSPTGPSRLRPTADHPTSDGSATFETGMSRDGEEVCATSASLPRSRHHRDGEVASVSCVDGRKRPTPVRPILKKPAKTFSREATPNPEPTIVLRTQPSTFTIARAMKPRIRSPSLSSRRSSYLRAVCRQCLLRDQVLRRRLGRRAAPRYTAVSRIRILGSRAACLGRLRPARA